MENRLSKLFPESITDNSTLIPADWNTSNEKLDNDVRQKFFATIKYQISGSISGRNIEIDNYDITQWIQTDGVRMSETYGGYNIMEFIDSIGEKLKAIDKVMDIRVCYSAKYNKADFSILVNMPKYDEELVREVFDVEMQAEELAEKFDLFLGYHILPFPYVRKIDSANTVQIDDLE